MGKKSNHENEPLFTPVKTTDDEDDVELANNTGGPTTRYRDDPQAAASSSHHSSKSDDGGPAIRYRDDSSIFDWGDSATDTKANKSEEADEGVGHDMYQIDDLNPDGGGFSPVSLRDDDGSNDEENGSDCNDEGVRLKANNLLKQRVWDETTYDDDDDDDERIFVGGGLGRHGSQFSCPRGCCSCCRSTPKYSRGPPDKGHSMYRIACLAIAFLMLVFGAGYLGYEAGLPVDDDGVEDADDDMDNNETSATGSFAIHKHPHTKGEQWIDWVKHEEEEIHNGWKNFTFHKPHRPKKDTAFKKSTFQPMTQAELLKLSESVFQACSERSLKTVPGREACLSQCHGHYCCFEKDVAFGSCVAEANSYCFAYAACENAITDFHMNNAIIVDNSQPVLNSNDIKLLSETCSKNNVGTLVGIRDCSAFCQHHLCCFSDVEGENCRADHAEECQAYGACEILIHGPDYANKAPAATNKNNVPASEQTFKSECMQGNLQQNWMKCRTHCAHFECCFSREKSCYDANHLECDEYNICEAFFLDDAADGDEEDEGDDPGKSLLQYFNAGTAEQMKHRCSPANLDQNLIECEKYCLDYDCCFYQRDSCYLTNKHICDDNDFCSNIDTNDVASSSDVGWESPQEVANDGNNILNNDMRDSGISQSGNVEIIKDIDNAVHAVCGNQDHHPENDSWVTACHALCANYLCCFSTDGTESNCRDSYGDAVCNSYQGCIVLHTSSSESNSNVNENGSQSNGATTIIAGAPSSSTQSLEEKKHEEVEAVIQACVPKAHRDPWLYEKCNKACDARSCCFEDGVGSCQAMNVAWCDEFEPCELLYT